MLPEPLHPAVVHFPMVLVVLLPLVALVALWAIRRGARPGRAWLAPLAVAAALTLSAWLAIRTGEAEEERVEAVVSEQVLHEHEEAAERFLVLSGVLLLVTGVGLLRNTFGTSARVLATAGAFGLILAGVQVGSAGGDLVYSHGAASAYVQGVDAGLDGGSGRSEDPDDRGHE
jgi:uncharacterized membrane protein